LSSSQSNKNGHICAPFALLKDKMLSASGGRLRLPDSLTRGSDPVCVPLGAPRPDARYRLALSACHEPPHFYDEV